MGEISDGMQDGTLCAGCGVYLGEGCHEQPLFCGYCARDRRAAGHKLTRLGAGWQDWGNQEPPTPMTTCRRCGRSVKVAGLNDHLRDAHGFVKPV